ncbi:MAG: adenosylcobinamide-GDP ribazoletransferase [Pseudomonadota bacterium]
MAELRIATLFLTRLPVRLGAIEAGQPLGAAVRAFPLIGAGVGLIGGAAYALADVAGLSSRVAALLAIVAMITITGALHEDGLADAADALGGADRDQRLAIMRESRIGVYGALALIFAVLLRAEALSHAGWAGEATLLLVAAAALSRAVLPAVMFWTEPARRDGLAFAAGRPDRRRVVDAGMIGAALAILCLGPVAGAVAAATCGLVACGLARLAWRRFGGHTGDTLGAIQQAGEIAVLLAFLASPW